MLYPCDISSFEMYVFQLNLGQLMIYCTINRIYSRLSYSDIADLSKTSLFDLACTVNIIIILSLGIYNTYRCRFESYLSQNKLLHNVISLYFLLDIQNTLKTIEKRIYIIIYSLDDILYKTDKHRQDNKATLFATICAK